MMTKTTKWTTKLTIEMLQRIHDGHGQSRPSRRCLWHPAVPAAGRGACRPLFAACAPLSERHPRKMLWTLACHQRCCCCCCCLCCLLKEKWHLASFLCHRGCCCCCCCCCLMHQQSRPGCLYPEHAAQEKHFSCRFCSLHWQQSQQTGAARAYTPWQERESREGERERERERERKK